MSEIQLVHFTFGNTSATRSQRDAIALREARIATERHDVATASVARGQVFARLQLAVAGGVRTTDVCNCPA